MAYLYKTLLAAVVSGYNFALVNWHYTKTVFILLAAQIALRIPIMFYSDATPFVTGGSFWVWIDMTIVCIPGAIIADLISRRREKRRLAASGPSASRPPYIPSPQ